MGKNIGTNISKNLSGKYSPRMLAVRQKLFDHAKQFATDALKTSSKRVIKKAAEATGDLIGNKAANKNIQQNNLETVINENNKEITKERYMSTEKKTRNY